jgi:glyoxylase-like metal-dependent hydrolase (beta-lactamase superfamily II)
MAYRVTDVAPGVWVIDEGMVQSYLIEGENQALLIDSCMSGGADFTGAIRALTTKPVTLVITHSDQDHTAGQVDFLPAFMHPSEFELYAQKGNAAANARAIWEGETFDLGGVILEIILIPGHTPGSIALLDRANGRLFIGDSVSDAWIYMFGEGRSVSALIASMEKLERLVGLEGAVGSEGSVGSSISLHPAHGSTTLGVEWITRTRIAAEKLLAGELEAKEPPQPLPCKLDSFDGGHLRY